MATLSSEGVETDSVDFDGPKSDPPSPGLDGKSSKTSPELALSNKISSMGVGLGYAAAFTMQIISVIFLVIFSRMAPNLAKTSIPMRIILFFVGVWWASWTIPAALWLRRRPGPPLPAHIGSGNKWFHWLSYITFAWSSLWGTIKIAAQLKQVVLFLIGWFILSDAIATVSGTAILFARVELQMGTALVALLSIVATSSGMAGAFLWPVIAKRFKLASNHVIVACIILFEIIPLYGLLGFIPFVKRWGVGGMQQQWEIFPMAVIHGFVLGGFTSHCRSYFGVLIPPGREAAFYSLFAFTDKGSSVIGPAIVGRIVDKTGSIRSAFWFLAVLNLLPGPLILLVDALKGRADALMMADKSNGMNGNVGGSTGSGVHHDEETENLLSGRDD